jgi:AcrR family transcriptional regulator
MSSNKRTNRKRARPYHLGNVKQSLIEATEKLIDAESLDAVTVRRLTGLVGVVPANFYNHFANLDELLAHVAARKMLELTAAMDEVRARHRKPLLRVRAAARAFVHFARDNPQAYRLIFGQRVESLTQYPVFRDAAEDSFEVSVIEMYGENLYDRSDPKGSHRRCAHAYALFALLNGVAYDVIDRLATLDTIDEIDEFVDMMIDSLLLGRVYADLHERFA